MYKIDICVCTTAKYHIAMTTGWDHQFVLCGFTPLVNCILSNEATLWLLCTEGMVRMLSVTVTVSPLVTGDLSTSIDTVSTGGLAALGVQFRVKGAPTIN